MSNSYKSSFLSCEKDCEEILRKLFIDSGEYSNILKRLLVINTKDCIDNTDSDVYKQAVDKSLSELYENGYIRLEPRLTFSEHEEVKSYIILSFDNFLLTSNREFRDCTISFDILCHTDQWDIGGFRLRPLKIAGYIDGILNNTRLTGIGQLQFLGCKELVLDEKISGYTLMYKATHGSDDLIS